jgi:hypothetical protein
MSRADHLIHIGMVVLAASLFHPEFGVLLANVYRSSARFRIFGPCQLAFSYNIPRNQTAMLTSVPRSLRLKAMLSIARLAFGLAVVAPQRRGASHQQYECISMRTNSTDYCCGHKADPKAAEDGDAKRPFPGLTRYIDSLRSSDIASQSTDVKPRLSVCLCTSSSCSRRWSRISFPILTCKSNSLPCGAFLQKDEANIELGELDRARNNVHRDFDPIKLCISRINVVHTREDKVTETFRHDS